MLKNVRLSLSVKLFGLSALLLVLMTAVTIVGLSGMSSLNSKTDTSYKKGTQPLASLGDARADYVLSRVLTLRYQYVVAPKDRPALRDTITATDRKVDAELAAVRETLVTAKGKAADKKLTSLLSSYREGRNQLLDAAAAGTAVSADLNRKLSALGDQVVASFAVLTKTKTDLTARQRTESASAFKTARTTVLILLLLAVAFGAVTSFLLVRAIRHTTNDVIARLRSLRERDTAALRDGLQHLADGDLTVEVAVVTEPIERLPADELGDIAREVNAVREDTTASVAAYNASRASLGGLVSDVADATRSVSLASQQMASTSNEAGRAVGEIANAMTDVVEGAERQVDAVRTTQERVEAVAATSATSAAAVEETANAATQAREVAGKGAEAVTSATEAMIAVREGSDEATKVIRNLGAKSDEIGGIVDAITGIAEQTNLLALNAAIEAARAGEQGRGFAVVAEEVRKLAEESQAAAASIADLIREIQAETGRAVEVVEAASRRTEEGVTTVEQAREGFRAIDAAVSDMVARVEQIAGAVGEIATNADAVRSEIAEVSAVAERASAASEQVSASTEETSASTEEIAASAQELADTAAQLERLAERFTLAR
jgi:methyl-accepting chemotaxis protein